MGYYLYIAEKFLDHEQNPFYIGMTHFPINTMDIHKIISSMNNLGIEIWKVKEDRKTIHKSPLFKKIEDKNIRQRTRIKSQ